MKVEPSSHIRQVNEAVAHPRLILVTRDAHGLYSKFGFGPVKAPQNYMERLRVDIYQIGETK